MRSARGRGGIASVAAALAFALVTSACGDDGGATAEGYCGRVKLHLEALNAPAIDSVEEVAQTLAMYRDITSSAPVAVQPEWEQLLESLETASTVDPDDPESLQRVADTARATRPAATRVQQYTDQVCDLQIAQPPPVTNPVTATTVPEGPTTVPGASTTLIDDGA